MNVLRGIIGIVFLIGVAYVFSSNKKKIDWPLVVKALVIQIVLAFLILKVNFVKKFFEFAGKAFAKISEFSVGGAEAILGSELTNPGGPVGFVFAFRVLPTILFFSALVGLLYYWGVVQKLVYAFAWLMKKALRISGAESLATAGNIFLGQTEAPLLIRPYLGIMTKSEMMTLMTGGMATIAGSVLVSYIDILGGVSDKAEFAMHLLSASILSAPAAILAAKIIVPETKQINNELKLSKDKFGSNPLEAIVNGTGEGLKLAVNVAAMLLVFTAFVVAINFCLEKFGSLSGLNEVIASNTIYKEGLSFEFVVGYLFAPIAWLIGICSEDMILVGQLLGEKTILNEYVAYGTLGDMKNEKQFFERKSLIMSTYVLCGFANFASIGIQIGGIGSLVPNRKGLLSSLGFKALIGGTLACLFTAAIVGMFY